jgi:hypothetical protein
MNSFQYSGLLFIAVLVVLSVVNAARRQSRLGTTALWLSVWCAAGLAIIMPERTTELARVVGIDRGADLVSYCAILAGMAGFFLVFLRLRHIDRQITLLVRQIALTNGSPSGEEKKKEGEARAPGEDRDPSG